MSWIQNNFSQMGYTVLFVPETATELITGGIVPWTCRSAAEYQIFQMNLQREKERVYEHAVKTMNSEKVLIVCDRGMIDNKAYMEENDFNELLNYLGVNEI